MRAPRLQLSQNKGKALFNMLDKIMLMDFQVVKEEREADQ